MRETIESVIKTLRDAATDLDRLVREWDDIDDHRKHEIVERVLAELITAEEDIDIAEIALAHRIDLER